MVPPPLALFLAFAAPPAVETPAFEVSDIEVVATEASAHLLAYDGEGELAAELVVWIDSEDRQRIDANFADGLYLVRESCRRGCRGRHQRRVPSFYRRRLRN